MIFVSSFLNFFHFRPIEKFYKAEDYHQNYYNKNSNAQYCRLIIQPKLRKLNLK
ncbi:MAG: peptide-methionine (S)-S-oxide reductase [Candidatus Aenigmarchaeota archaeon]|nr:peptide-methionine (S)-S-oxide reductase [Candidatus Aenigmarchaeota archaeon]